METSVRRCYALKVVPNEGATIVKSFCEMNSEIIGDLMRVFAFVLEWGMGEGISREQDLQTLKTHSPKLGEWVDNYLSLAEERQRRVKGWTMFLILSGARAWDNFYAVAGEKTKFSSVDKALKALHENTADSDATEDFELRAMLVEQKELLGAAEELFAELKAAAEEERWQKPFGLVADSIAVLPRALRKLVIEGACQALLSHYELRLQWQENCAEFRKERAVAEATKAYQDYLSFRKEHSDLIQSLVAAPKRKWGYVEVLRDPRIRTFFGDPTKDEALQGKRRADLVQASPAVKWFHENHMLWCRFAKGPAKPPTLTFAGAEHPFHLTLPGPLTDKDSYRLCSMPTNNQPGHLQVKVVSEGSERMIDLYFHGRPELADLKPINGHAYFGKRNATLGGLRLRPKGKDLFLDLVVNIEADTSSPAAKAITWNKDEKRWNIPAELRLASVILGPWGLWRCVHELTASKWQPVQSGPLNNTEPRWEKLPPVTVQNGLGRRQVTKSEFGHLLQAIQRKRPLTQIVVGADDETQKTLAQHLAQRNKRAQKKGPDVCVSESFGIGALICHERHIDALVSELKRTENALAGGNAANAKKKRSELIDQLSAARKHARQSKDDMLRKAVAVTVKELIHQRVDLVILPAKPPVDPQYRRGKDKSCLENRALGAARIGAFYERLESALQLVGIRVLRMSTAYTTTLCPKCGAKGRLFRDAHDKNGERTKLVHKNASGKKKTTGQPAGRPRPEGVSRAQRFACGAEDCAVRLDARHVQATNLLHRFARGKDFAPADKR